MRTQNQRAQRRAQRESDDSRQDQRNTDRDRELHVNRPDHASIETDRCIDRHRNQRRCDNRAGDLPHAFACRLFRRKLLLLNQTHRVFHDDDRIIDQRPDHQNQGEHRQNIHAHSQRNHEHEGSDQSHGNRQSRDQRGAPVLKEQIGDQYHKDKGNEKRLNDFRHCRADEAGGVVGHQVIDARREIMAEAFQFRFHGIDHVQRVGVVVAVDRHADTFLAVVVAGAGIGVRTELHTRNIADTHLPRHVSASDDDVLEFINTAQAPYDVDFELHLVMAELGSAPAAA